MRGDRDKIIALAGHTQRPDIRDSSAPVIEHRVQGAWNAVALTHLGLFRDNNKIKSAVLRVVFTSHYYPWVYQQQSVPWSKNNTINDGGSYDHIRLIYICMSCTY